MPVTPPANRDRSAAKFAVRRRRRRAREVALADLDAARRQIETVGRLPHVQKVAASLTLRAAAYARTALRPLRCWMKMGMDTVYMKSPQA